MAFVNKRTEEHGLVTIDEDSGVFLKHFGTNRERVTSFKLFWCGQEIAFHAEQKPPQFDAQGQTNIEWCIGMLAVPVSLQDKKEKIKNSKKLQSFFKHNLR